MQTLMSIALAVAGVLGTMFVVGGLWRPQTQIGKIANFVAGLAVGVGVLFYFAVVGENFTDTLACKLFWFTERCQASQLEARSGAPVRSLAPPRTDPSAPEPLQVEPPEWRSLPTRDSAMGRWRLQVPVPVDGDWWLVGEPQGALEDVPWEGSPGACAPLSKYIRNRPQGLYAQEARSRIGRREARRATVSFEQVLASTPWLRSTKSSLRQTVASPAQACEALLEAQARSNDSSCRGAVTALNRDGVRASLLSVDAERGPGLCVCQVRQAGDWHYRCRVKVAYSCRVRAQVPADLERCL